MCFRCRSCTVYALILMLYYNKLSYLVSKNLNHFINSYYIPIWSFQRHSKRAIKLQTNFMSYKTPMNNTKRIHLWPSTSCNVIMKEKWHSNSHCWFNGIFIKPFFQLKFICSNISINFNIIRSRQWRIFYIYVFYLMSMTKLLRLLILSLITLLRWENSSPCYHITCQ